jgi:RNA polymerase sigma factor (sigma-70 family)
MMDAKEDQLIKRSCQGDTSAYADLIHGHSRRVFSICFGITGHQQDAEDLTQQTLIKGFKKLRHLKKRQSFGPWISQVARNLCIDHLRKTHRHNNTVSEYAQTKASGLTDNQDTSRDFSGLLNALQKLKPEDRTALSLYYFEGQSTQNVAHQLHTSESTLLVRLSRARKKLRTLLMPEGGVL